AGCPQRGERPAARRIDDGGRQGTDVAVRLCGRDHHGVRGARAERDREDRCPERRRRLLQQRVCFHLMTPFQLCHSAYSERATTQPEIGTLPPMPEHVYQVSELIRQINLDLYRYNDIAVEGEVTNYTRSTAGHHYFSIKDARASMRVVMFSTAARFLRFRIENGLKLVVRGRLAIYEQKGEFQLNAVAAEPAGLGALQLAFEQLKRRLAEEGLFDVARKKPIPMLPARIAVVTSPNGAAIRDILNVIGRRFEGLHLQIYPVRVQGTHAAREIAAAVRHLSRWQLHDVVLICRGGGSLEDLWPFNEEVVARAVAACSVPTISGVGHETDFTICDLVADLRAPTPSAAAEIVIRAKSEICAHVDALVRRVRSTVESRVLARRERLNRERVSLYRMVESRARELRARLRAANEPLAVFPARIARARHRLEATA